MIPPHSVISVVKILYEFVRTLEAAEAGSEVKPRASNEVAVWWSLSHVSGAVIDECGALVVMTGRGNRSTGKTIAYTDYPEMKSVNNG
jgi:hypothetical protein